MTSAQLVGYTLAQTSAVTAITSTRIYHGNRPDGSVLPAINYFSLNDSPNVGTISEVYTINNRAEDIATSKRMARLVQTAFLGSSFSGQYGVMNSFNVSRISLANPSRTIPETAERCFNTPVDIRLVYHAGEET